MIKQPFTKTQEIPFNLGKAGFNATANTTAPVISVNGRIINKTLDNGVWTIEPEYGQKPSAGTYDVSLQTSNYTNGVTNADLYNIIKRTYSFFPWEFFGQDKYSSTNSNLCQN